MALEGAKAVKKILDEGLEDAYKAGIISDKKFKELLKRNNTKGYWPRVYNEFYLNSPTGRDKWIDTLTQYKWTAEEADKALKTLTDTAEKGYVIPEGMAMTKEGKYYRMNRRMALKLYDNRRISAASVFKALSASSAVHLY